MTVTPADTYGNHDFATPDSHPPQDEVHIVDDVHVRLSIRIR